MNDLVDSLGRKFEYLRLSVTEVCNFKCAYCLPNGYQAPCIKKSPLNLSEIKNLITAFAELGFWKVRLTGGEPLLRRDICDLVRTARESEKIREVALSTNGYRLLNLLPYFREVGLNSLNVSLDSLNPNRFQKITGRNFCDTVKTSLETAAGSGHFKVKANAVLMRSTWMDEFQEFQSWVKDKPITVRFIELMRTGKNAALFQSEHISSHSLKNSLLESGWVPIMRSSGAGPATEFSHPDFVGKLGIIAPYSKSFCDSCNRLRVTAQGQLQLCLFGNGNFPLRPLLRHEEQQQELVSLISNLVTRKQPSHNLAANDYGTTSSLSQVGG